MYTKKKRIRFHFSTEQDYKVGLNYFKFNRIEYYKYQQQKTKHTKSSFEDYPLTSHQKTY
jgi:hypothetical protein